MAEPGADRAADLAQIEADLAEGRRQRDEPYGTGPGALTEADLRAADLAQIERDMAEGRPPRR